MEDRLRDSAFGFRAHRSTADAIFIAKRLVEVALSAKKSKLSILLLDWAKAFDKISPSAMLSALQRFGITAPFIDMITAIYSDRTFQVKDGCRCSSTRTQCTGIAQGCPLSPYLFIIMLSVILDDVDVCAGPGAADVTDTTYADDTLLASRSIPDLQIYLDALIEVAAAYGLQPNWKKTSHLSIGHSHDIKDSNGEAICVSDQETYLGCLLTTSGRATPSLTKRLGEARSISRSSMQSGNMLTFLSAAS